MLYDGQESKIKRIESHPFPKLKPHYASPESKIKRIESSVMNPASFSTFIAESKIKRIERGLTLGQLRVRLVNLK